LMESFGGCLEMQCFSRAFVESPSDRVEFGLRVGGEVNPLGQICLNKPFVFSIQARSSVSG
jgi:hypothetical protein